MKAAVALGCLAGLMLILAMDNLTVGPKTATPPNFIFILADDLGWSCLSSQMDDQYSASKSDYFETPHLDRLARMGMRMTNGYAPAALCSPTRRSIQFGHTPIRQGDESFKAMYHPDNVQRLTIPTMLKAADPRYRTAHYGKWDLRADIFPEDLGYDESDGNTGNNNGDYGSDKNNKWTEFIPSNDPKRIESLTGRTTNFIERQVQAGHPFFVQLSHYATHVDMQARQETYDKYVKKEKGVKHAEPAWAAMLEDLDAGIGKLLDKVHELGIEDNTYIIFMTDNGAAEFIPPVKNKLDHPSTFDRPMRNHPLRGGKWVLYEGGIRVPFLITGPGVKAGSQCAVPVVGWDILPTLADLAGYKQVLPDDLDGGSWRPVLEQGRGPIQRRDDALYFHRYQNSWPHSAIRVGDLKLIHFWKTNKLELYDLGQDLGETKDLAQLYPEQVKVLNERLTDYIRSVDAEIRGYLGETTDHFADNGFGKPLSSLQHPAGEHFQGVTYVAYQGPHEDPYVCAYNHNTKSWTGPVQAGISALGDDPPATDADEIDNHGRPALFVDRQGYIHLFFGGHGGHSGLGSNPLGFHGSGRQTHVVSRRPGDITSWQVLDNISVFGTYSQIVKMPNGDVYLFYRHGPHRSDWVYQKSTDDGRTFAAPVSILRHQPEAAAPAVYETWYAWFTEGPDNTIVAVFNYHPCATKPDHSALRVNGYAMRMNTADGSWENINGQVLQMPLTKASADTGALVYDSRGERTRLGTIAADAAGHLQLYLRSNAEGQAFVLNSWNGKEWLTNGSKKPQVSDADLLISSGQKTELLATYKNGEKSEISWWRSEDQGQHWKKERILLSAEHNQLVMSALIRNAHPDARVIAAELAADPSDLSSKLYLLGNSGPVSRHWTVEK